MEMPTKEKIDFEREFREAESLKPCLWCGEIPTTSMYSPLCECKMGCTQSGWMPIEFWNNAWAHKKISEQERRIAALEHQNQELRELKAEMERIRKEKKCQG